MVYIIYIYIYIYIHIYKANMYLKVSSNLLIQTFNQQEVIEVLEVYEKNLFNPNLGELFSGPFLGGGGGVILLSKTL